MRTAIVTGASGGIGDAVYKALPLSAVEVYGPGHQYLDVAKRYDWECRDFRYFDYLICCHAAPIGATFQQQIDVDLVGTYNACMAVLPGMVKRKFGRIVLLSSIRAQHPRPAGQVAYAAAKAGTEGLARALASEYGPHGITCNVVAPGAVDTPRTRANIAAGIVSEAELIARTPAGRLTKPEEVAAAVLWLCSDTAAMINGVTLMVDGGWSISG